MFGQKTTFGAPSTGFGGFGTPTTSNAFGATNPTSTFGSTAPAFGQPAASTGGLFGAAPAANNSGGLFGNPQPAAATSAGFGFGAGASTSFGGASSAFKPAGGFGATSSFNSAPAQGGGMFGAPTSQPNNAFGGFGATSTAGGFGAAQNTGAASSFGAFGQQQQQQVAGTTVKFNPPTGSDTMMKSGVQQNINIRHQCISCMKEYENKSLEELRIEDYLANRKGPQAGGTTTTGGLFGAAPNQTAPSAGGGLFGRPATTQSTTGGLFGSQPAQNKPLFGAPATGGFGATSTGFGATTGGFGTNTAATSGGLFGAKTTGFGAPTTSSTTTGFAFGNNSAAGGGGLFGAQNQQNNAFNKPFGAVAPQASTGGLFGSTAPAFGASNTFGAQNTTGGFGAPAANQNTSIGLFGQQNQPKPLGFGASTGFGAATTSAPSAFGFGAPTNSTAPFGASTQPKPAFGFGAPGTTNTSSAFGFGAPQQQQQQQPQAAGGLFGSQNKPAFGFGAGTSTAPSFGATGSSFGTSFGATNTTGSLFGSNNNQPKPLFGGGSTSFGTNSFGTTGGVGSGGSSFGFGGGSSSFGGLGTNQPFNAQQNNQFGAPQMQGGQSQPMPSLQSQLASLTSNPYGDNPLFKNLLPDSNRREEIMKPTNPVAQKAVLSSAPQYKVSPHGLKAKVKPLNGSKNSLGNKSAIFDGLEEDDNDSGNDIFIPRSSVKKLVLKPKVNNKTSADVSNIDESNLNESASANFDESLALPSVKKLPAMKAITVDVHDESFSNMASKRKDPHLDESAVIVSTPEATSSQSPSNNMEDQELAGPQPAGIRLKRAGYYTIPNMAELSTMVDSEGNLNVENFTIGRTGYGNIFFPGITNVKNMNFDDIVFFRHKEVIVYPDDSNKPELGQGLNKKAQVTLDKVWPVDKTTQSSVKSPEKLAHINYEEKLQKACIKLGARFVEYRPETGSWVFKVNHFSKYGLDDSDEDEVVDQQAKSKELNNKKLKTLQLREQPQLDVAPNVTIHATQDSFDDNRKEYSMMNNEDENNGGRLTSPMEETFQKINTSSNKVKLMKATLFDDDDEEDEDMEVVESSRPVILETRPTVLERRDKLVEDIASSMLGGNTSQGLGGGSMSFNTSQRASTMTSTLLKSQYLSMVASIKANTTTPAKQVTLTTSSGSSKKKKSHAPRYTLQAGYDRYVSLPNADANDEDAEARTVVPKHVDHFLPLKESILSSDNVRHLADFSLFMSRSFRVGWAPFWSVANPGESLAGSKALVRKEAATDILIERHEPLEVLDSTVIDSFESWLEVHLENCVLSFDDDHIPKFEAVQGINGLHAHAEEAERQFSITQDLPGIVDMKEVLELLVALLGRLRPQKTIIAEEDEIIMDDDEDEDDIAARSQDCHKTTMERKHALTKWLEKVTANAMKADLKAAKSKNCHLDEILALLSGNKRLEACDRALDKGDHYLANLISTAVGPNLVSGQLLQNQLERWQEGRADKFIEEKRLKLFSLIAGNPVWPGTDITVNTCEGLDWKRAFGLHLWYFTSPASSISDALNLFEEAFQTETSQFGAYAKAPRPSYVHDDYDDDESLFDIRFHLLKLYANKAHSIESIAAPRSYTRQPLDFKMGWIVSQILYSVGYRHMSHVKREAHHVDFAAQLEALGLWHWAIFVLLHLQDPVQRQKLAKDVLARNVIPSDDECAEREIFLQDRLAVPLAWIAEAKAVRSFTESNFGDQAWYLLRAECWNEAHEVIVKKIAPDAIINDEYEFFFSLLQDLASLEDTATKVTNWSTQGQVFYDFIKVDLKVRELVEKRDEANVAYEIETLRPKVMSLCARINSLPITCAKERLCQSEIAKKMAHLTRVVLNLEGEEQNQAEVLAQILAQLPLPDDYMLQELRTLSSIHMKELLRVQV